MAKHKSSKKSRTKTKVTDKAQTSSITFRRTGNFWIDNGIVGLYYTLQKLDSETERERLKLKSFRTEFSEDGTHFTVSTKNQNDLVYLINAARDSAVEKFVTESTKNKRNIVFAERTRKYSNPLKKNFFPAYKDFYAGKVPTGTKAIELNSKNVKRGTQAVLTKKDIEKLEQFKEKHAELKTEKNVWLNDSPKYDVGNPFEISFLERGKKFCAFSNENWRTTEAVKGYNFPFVAGSGGINFFSQFTGSFEISSLYAFASIFSPLNVFYSLSLKSEQSCYFIPYDENIGQLSVWLNSLQTIRILGDNKSCNFRKPMIKTKDKEFGMPTTYLNESLIIFLYSMFLYAYKEMKRDYRKEVLTKNVVSMVSDGNIFREVRIFSKIEPLFELFEAIGKYEKEEKGWNNGFVGMFNSFSDPQNRDIPWKERLAKAIMDFTSVCGIVEEFLGDVAMRDERSHFFISHFVELYTKENQLMNPSTISLCKSLGNMIGRRCRETKDKGILYSLRNSKNRTDFLKVLSDAQFRLEIGYSEQFFVDLPDSPEWEEMKSLVTIFAMNSFLYNPQSKGEAKNG
jgi:hypothetical protein